MRRPIDRASYLAGIARVCSQGARGNTVVGVAFFAGNGYLLTCAHVVGKALLNHKKWQKISAEEMLRQKVMLEFRQGESQWEAQAKVVFWRFNSNCQKSDNDIAVLKLTEKMPEGLQPLPMADRKDYDDQSFEVFGFPSGLDIGGWASGQIKGDTYDTAGRVQIQDTLETGYAIEPGFSGSPVWSPNCGNAIVGMTVARDQEREAAKVGFMLPVLRLKRALEQIDIESLIDILLPYAETKRAEIQRAYRAIVGDRLSRYPLATQRESISALRDNLTQLATVSAPGEGPISSLHQFAACLSLPEFALPEPLPTALREWLELRVDEQLERLMDTAQKNLASLLAEPAQPLPPHLLIWVRFSPDYASQARYLVGAQLIRAPDHYDARSGVGGKTLNSPKAFRDPTRGDTVALSDLEKIVQKCLVECSSDNLHELTLELFLPLDLLDSAAEHWSEQAIEELPPYLQDLVDEPDEILPIGFQYRVVLRMTDRLEHFPTRRSQWQAKWSDLMEAVKRCQTAQQTLIPGQAPDFRTTFAKTDCLGMHLVTPLPDNERQKRFLALAAGAVPTALWLRRMVPKAHCTRQFNQLLTYPIGEIAGKVREVRQEAYTKFPKTQDRDRHFGHHLALIWENPRLVPPEAEDDNAVDMPLEMP